MRQASSIQRTARKNDPKVSEPNGKAWSKLMKNTGSGSTKSGARGAPAQNSATAAATSATIQANIPTVKKRSLVGSMKSIYTAQAIAAFSPAGRFVALRARIPVLIPATASPMS